MMFTMRVLFMRVLLCNNSALIPRMLVIWVKTIVVVVVVAVLCNNSALIPRMLVIWILTIVVMVVVVEGMSGRGGWRKTCISSVTENVEEVAVATNEF